MSFLEKYQDAVKHFDADAKTRALDDIMLFLDKLVPIAEAVLTGEGRATFESELDEQLYISMLALLTSIVEGKRHGPQEGLESIVKIIDIMHRDPIGAYRRLVENGRPVILLGAKIDPPKSTEDFLKRLRGE